MFVSGFNFQVSHLQVVSDIELIISDVASTNEAYTVRYKKWERNDKAVG